MLRPIDGVREYYSGASVAAAFFGALPVALVRIKMAQTEFSASRSVLTVLAAVGSALLCIGLLLSYILARVGRKTALFSAGAGLVSAVGIGLLIPSETARLFNGTDVLGALETVCMLSFLVCLCILLVMLFISAMGMRIAASAGTPAAVTLIVAGMTYIFRAATSFSSLLTALGKNFNWDNTDDLGAAKRWILRTVPEDSAQAHTMVTVSLIFAVSVIFALLMSISLILRFRPHFEEFGRRMLVSAETLRDSGYYRDEEEEFDEEDQEDCDDDYYDGIETLERSRYEAEKHEELRQYRQESERVRREAAYRTARMGGYRDEGSIYDAIEKQSDERSSQETGRPEQREDSGDQGKPAEKRTPSGAVKVKVRTVRAEEKQDRLPDPDDASIWDHYLD